jgi:hypothetical protein
MVGLTNFLRGKMIPTNELENLLTAKPIDGGDDAGRAVADRGSADTVIEMPFLSNWPTQHMTATWGN